MAALTNNSINGLFAGGPIPKSTVASGAPAIAGSLGDIYFDTAGMMGYTCTTAGAAGVAVWTADSSSVNSFMWNNATTATTTMMPNNGYVNNATGAATYTLPATMAVGQRVAIQGSSVGTGWTLAQLAGQSIHFGNVTTSTGTGGSLASTNANDGLEVICTVANTTFEVRNSMGNIAYV